jgi:hypothetical protein
MSGRQPAVKIIPKSLSQNGKKHVVPSSLSGIRVGKRKKKILYFASSLVWCP